MKTKLQHEKKGKVLKLWRSYPGSKDGVWQALTDYIILDRWWAPQPWTCQTKSQDFREGGHWFYAMRGPEGEVHWSLEKYLTIDPGTSYTANDFFADEHGNPNDDMPSSHWNISLEEHDGGTLMTTTCTFQDEKTLNEYLEMGFLEGYEMGLNNLDGLLDSKNNQKSSPIDS